MKKEIAGFKRHEENEVKDLFVCLFLRGWFWKWMMELRGSKEYSDRCQNGRT